MLRYDGCGSNFTVTLGSNLRLADSRPVVFNVEDGAHSFLNWKPESPLGQVSDNNSDIVC